MDKQYFMKHKYIYTIYKTFVFIKYIFLTISFISLGFLIRAFEPLVTMRENREVLSLLKQLSINYFSFNLIFLFISFACTILLFIITKIYRKKYADIINYYTLY